MPHFGNVVGPELEQLSADTIRVLSAEGIQEANSGHPGLPMGSADIANTLYTRFLNVDPTDPTWINRDRFVLSAGHGSMLVYSLLHLSGFGLTLEDLRDFRQWDSKTPGHPELGHTAGVDTTTGPLGAGFGNAVGFAIAEEMLAALERNCDPSRNLNAADAVEDVDLILLQQKRDAIDVAFDTFGFEALHLGKIE